MRMADYKRAANLLAFLRCEMVLLSELGIGPRHRNYLTAIKDAALVDAFYRMTGETDDTMRDVMRRNKHLYQ